MSIDIFMDHSSASVKRLLEFFQTMGIIGGRSAKKGCGGHDGEEPNVADLHLQKKGITRPGSKEPSCRWLHLREART